MSEEKYITVKGIVLKESALGENDKLLTVFSGERGRLSVAAKGARRPKSRFLAVAQLFSYGKLELYAGKSMYVLRGAELIENFYQIRCDLDRLTAASEISRLVLRVVQENLPDEETAQLILHTFYYLNKGTRAPRLLTSIFRLRLLCIQGFLSGEAVQEELNRIGFSQQGTARAVMHICEAEPETLFRFSVSDAVLDEIDGLSALLVRETI